MTRDPMDDGAYMAAYPEYENISAGAQTAAAHRQRDDLKALVRDQAAEIERRTLRHAQHVEALQEVAKDNERLEAENARLKETAHSDRTKLFEENRARAAAIRAVLGRTDELVTRVEKLLKLEDE